MMQSYSERQVFGDNAMIMLRRANNIVAALPYDALRCHEVARVVAKLLGGVVVDGKYGVVDHSWLVINNEPMFPRCAILDPYVVGRLPQVQLVSVTLGLNKLYVDGPQRTDIDNEMVEHLIEYVKDHVPHT